MLANPDYEMLCRDFNALFESAPWRTDFLQEPDFELPPTPLPILAEKLKRSISASFDTQIMEVIRNGDTESSDHSAS